MTLIAILFIGCFLPLFPFSIVFNQVLHRLPSSSLKIAIIIAWPQLGLLLLARLNEAALASLLPWLITWAAITALLYGFRLLSQRDIANWVGFLATSAWSLLWIPALLQPDLPVYAYALSFSLPLSLLLGLTLILNAGFGAAYTHLYAGLASTMPRFSGILVFTLLAATATPIFPAFFAMLHSITLAPPVIAVLLVLTWLLWSWASARLLQGLIVGVADEEHPTDISWAITGLYAASLGVCVVLGLYWIGGVQ